MVIPRNGSWDCSVRLSTRPSSRHWRYRVPYDIDDSTVTVVVIHASRKGRVRVVMAADLLGAHRAVASRW
jgi:hypothetical protein